MPASPASPPKQRKTTIKSRKSGPGTTTKQKFEKESATPIPQHKAPMTPMQLANALLLAGFFIASNLTEISILKFALQQDATGTHTGASSDAHTFVTSFYRWKADAPILKYLTYIALPIAPLLIHTYVKDAIYDTLISRKIASKMRNFCDVATLALFVGYVVLMIVWLAPYEKMLSISASHTVMQRMLEYQYIMMGINLLNTVIPVMKFADSVRERDVVVPLEKED